MNQRSLPLSRSLPHTIDSSDAFIDLDRLFSAIQRRYKTLVFFTIAAILCGAAYLAFATPLYTSMTQVLIDDSLSRYAEEQESSAQTGQQLDTRIASTVEILKSGKLALRVVDQADLSDNELLTNPPRSLMATVKGWVAAVSGVFAKGARVSEDDLANARRQKAAAMLQQSLRVERVSRSSVVSIAFTSPDPRLSALVARTYADAYLSDQLSANFEASERASEWLQERIDDLGKRAQTAAMEVETYKRDNNLTSTRGALMSEQQLADLNSQLIIAQADAASASARYDQLNSIIQTGPEKAVENSVLTAKEIDNSAIQELRSRYGAVSKREQDVTQNFGADHPQAVALRAEKLDLSRQIFRELQQMTATYRNEYEVARSREQSLRDSIDRVAGRNSDANEAQVKLRELEQKATTLKAVYESYLNRYEQASQQRSFPIAKARVISEAGLPVSPSSPKKTMILALSAVLGMMAGGAFAFVQEMRERGLRLESDVRSQLRHRSLGYLPLIGRKTAGQRSPFGRLFRRKRREDVESDEPMPLEQMTRIVRDAPQSTFAETLRNAKLACEMLLQKRPNKVIGIISAAPGEGNTTFAANFALLLASAGKRTLLVDADLRNPSLSRMLKPAPKAGLVEAVLGDVPWASAIKIDQQTRLAILPNVPDGATEQFHYTNEIFASPGMGTLMENARKTFDYTIVDLAPFGPVVDAKAFAQHADGFILVLEWGKTPSRLVRDILEAEIDINSKVLGVVLNKTDMEQLPAYGDSGGSEKFRKNYTRYYVE
ncbi:succinoglycan biosynthesis transport protein ExoP [Rhizobium subbaraonis]|uniref:non-specific protein-tyrosine kinase n=1 Tax=Rhizobium subbaraonis TaxID=908946 RepID=A0A285U229_9HYPH|nr:polysaccharide biosynthesis tyrosine autokinase [Rhizobium subbaraonis]SOC35882.1 succinoglycan biosynthesis transport protein ExoP [Rhizobium subbaraonis]